MSLAPEIAASVQSLLSEDTNLQSRLAKAVGLHEVAEIIGGAAQASGIAVTAAEVKTHLSRALQSYRPIPDAVLDHAVGGNMIVVDANNVDSSTLYTPESAWMAHLTFNIQGAAPRFTRTIITDGVSTAKAVTIHDLFNVSGNNSK